MGTETAPRAGPVVAWGLVMGLSAQPAARPRPWEDFPKSYFGPSPPPLPSPSRGSGVTGGEILTAVRPGPGPLGGLRWGPSVGSAPRPRLGEGSPES